MLLRSLVKIPVYPFAEETLLPLAGEEGGVPSEGEVVSEVHGVATTKAKTKKGSLKFSLADVDPDEIVRRDLDDDISEDEEESEGEGE